MTETESSKVLGGWRTELYMDKTLGWNSRPVLEQNKFRNPLRSMISSAKAWAASRGLQRKNPVHGAEEWRIPDTFDFSFEVNNTRETELTGSAEMEDRSGLLLNSGSDFGEEATIAPLGVLFGTVFYCKARCQWRSCWHRGGPDSSGCQGAELADGPAE